MNWSLAGVCSWRAGSARTGGSRSIRPQACTSKTRALIGIAQWFCSAVTTMFGSMAYAVDTLNRSDFSQASWLPVHSWTYSGGDYVIAVHGDLFLIAEGARLGSLDELNQLLRAGQP